MCKSACACRIANIALNDAMILPYDAKSTRDGIFGKDRLETAALRNCMDMAGKSLSKACVKALIQSGEVSQAEVDRRKKSGR